MADKKENDGSMPVKSLKMPLISGLVLALIGGATGFFAVSAGLFLSVESPGPSGAVARQKPRAEIGAMPDVAYVPVAPLVISLGNGVSGGHLRFRAELEVPSAYRAEVEKLMPRIVDVLNSYLRALELQELTDSAALLRLRAQLLRRLQVVTGGERINDLLIMEFILN